MLRSYAARDEGAPRLGEVALVDGDGRIGPLGTVFYDTLLDENAASHIALAQPTRSPPGTRSRSPPQRLLDPRRLHDRRPGLEVDGLAADGAETPLLRDGSWQI